MAIAQLELPTEGISSVPDPRHREPYRELHPPARFGLDAELVNGGQALRNFHITDRWESLLPGPPLPFRLAIGGAEPVAIDVTLQAVEVETEPSLGGIFRTSEDAGPVKIEMRLDVGALRVNMRYSIELPGLPIDEALHYTRFLKALHRSEGTLSVMLLEPERRTIADLPLPVPQAEAQIEELEWHLRLYEKLRDVGEATGAEMVAPGEIEDQDLANLERVNAVLRAGWVRDRVSEFMLPLAPEAAKNLLDFGSNVIGNLAITLEHEPVSLFGVKIDLGPNVRWVAEARLQTPRAGIQEWLDSSPDPKDWIETHWTPANEAPVHALFHDWPKPSLESIQEDIKAFEREYKMSWRTFSRLWKQGKPRARRIDDGSAWMSLIEMRDAMRQEAQS